MMDRYKLMDLIYDKLAGNDKQEQFEPSMADDMCVLNDWQDGGEPKIAMVIDGVEYVLSVKAHEEPSDFQVYEPTKYIGEE